MISITLTSNVFCVLLLIQSISAQCIGSRGPAPLAYAPELSAAGGSFAVRSTSPISPTGVTVLSDQLAIEGPLIIDGKLPFLGTVALEGSLPSAGAGNIAHSCGGAVGISSEVIPPSGAFAGSPIGSAALGSGMVGPSPLGRGLGLGGRKY
ncbi:unnamed protein product [Arctia plantaginis]|uniref:Uncharacterized protein n=1 Tax=Arctia plantaginis TaxID=874455 RepID=A0A8S1BI28_ARCPL|nr:unnamed protein product [Arctia plantaginis]